MIVQLCGLSGAGKTTLATKVQEKLLRCDIRTEIIDGDVYRKTVCKDLGFSKTDRYENIRRLGSIANEFSIRGIVSIISAINPYELVREELKHHYKNVTLVYLDCSLSTLQKRDTKGLYKKALLPEGHPKKIDNLTGVNDQFEIPLKPDLYIKTDSMSINQSVIELFHFIIKEHNESQTNLHIPRRLKLPA